MSAIRDQRQMSGVASHDSVESVRAFWEAFAEAQRAAGRPFSLERIDETLMVYVSAGRWVADCPRCGGGIAAWHENPEGACLDCGGVFPLDFPPADEREAAEAILSARPDEAQRSWLRQKGESLPLLKVENLVRDDPLAPPSSEAERALLTDPALLQQAMDELAAAEVG